jgi:hypothetical protein
MYTTMTLLTMFLIGANSQAAQPHRALANMRAQANTD